MENNDSCGPGCGCHVDRFPTEEKCPRCQGRLALSGSLQKAEFYLVCAACDYRSPRLSPERLQELL